MEIYEGIKFAYKQLSNSCPEHPLLEELNRWVLLFSQLGLSPVHSEGAYGNQSFRVEGDSFFITKTGMIPSRDLIHENYTLVEKYDPQESVFLTRGSHAPSSECVLHNLIYREDKNCGAILHGHSELINELAHELSIAETEQFYDYGTNELAESAVEMVRTGHRFFNLKDHGFVVLGPTIREAGQLALIEQKKILDYQISRSKDLNDILMKS